MLGLAGLLLASVIYKAIHVAMDQKRNYRMLSAYEGPPVEYIWGNARQKGEFHSVHSDWYKDNIDKYCIAKGKLCTTILAPRFFHNVSGTRNELVTGDPGLVKHLLQDKFDTWTLSAPGGRFLEPILYFLGNAIFTVDHGPHAERPADGGRMWHVQRRTGAMIFTRELFKTSYQASFQEATDELIGHLRRESGPKGDNVYDFQHWLLALTMDCFGKMAFGCDLNIMKGADPGFGVAFDGCRIEAFATIYYHLDALMLRELLPESVGAFAQKYLIERNSPHFDNLKKHSKDMRTFAQFHVDKKRKELAEGTATHDNDMLAIFVKMAKEEKFSDSDLVDMVINFISAGRDSTAGTLAWLFYRLGRSDHKAILATVTEEIDTVLGGATPTYDDINEMPYLRGCLWEAMRLHPFVAKLELVSKQEDTFPDGVVIPIGTQITIPTYAMGRSKEIYGDDVLEFKPERWIPFKMPSPFEFPMFKGGRRQCLGRDMALFQSTTVTATILQHFTPVTVNEEAYTYGDQFIVPVWDKVNQKEQLMMKMIPRENGAK